MLIDLLATMAKPDNDKRGMNQGFVRSGYVPTEESHEEKHERIKQLLQRRT